MFRGAVFSGHGVHDVTKCYQTCHQTILIACQVQLKIIKSSAATAT